MTWQGEARQRHGNHRPVDRYVHKYHGAFHVDVHGVS